MGALVIPARRSPSFSRLFAWHAERRLRAHFSAARIAGLEPLRAALAERPVLLVSSHSAWWDALWILVLAERLCRAEGYALMDARNLSRLSFFARVGAFGVDLSRREDGARAVRYAARLLDRPGRLLVVFPQGEERPRALRPLGFEGGAAAIARLAPTAAVFPMGLAYEHRAAPRPELWCAIGAPLAPLRELDAARSAQESAVTTALERIDAALAGDDAGFATLWGSTEREWAARALSRLTPLARE